MFTSSIVLVIVDELRNRVEQILFSQVELSSFLLPYLIMFHPGILFTF